jgi:hypothetical protein
MKKAVAVFCMFAAVFIVTCSKEDNPAGPGGGPNSMTMSYTLSGNMIIISQPQTIESYSYCNGATLVTRYDTSEAGSDTSTFALSNNDNTLTIDGQMILTRVGTGSGVLGQWTGGGMDISIGPSTITATESSSYPYADDFIEYDLPNDLGEITATKASNTQVILTGTTGETVTITLSSSSETYSSSNSAHATGTYYSDPVACPNDVPSWYDEFLSDNGASMFKKAMSKSVQKHQKLF